MAITAEQIATKPSVDLAEQKFTTGNLTKSLV